MLRGVHGRRRSLPNLSDARVEELKEGRPSTEFLLRDFNLEGDGLDGYLINVFVGRRKLEGAFVGRSRVDGEESRSEDGANATA